MIASSITSFDQLASTSKADIIEIRFDLFDHLDLSSPIKFEKPTIFTLRPVRQGGKFQGTEKERFQLIEKVLKWKPTFFDIEADTDPAFIEKIAKEYPDTKFIGSHHDFEKTPENLEFPSNPHFALSKLVTFANTSLDGFRMLKALKGKKNVIGHCMGEKGSFTRVLGKICGSAITYAGKTASGQFSVDDLIEVYRYKELNSETAIWAVIGTPIQQSIGPHVHNAVMKRAHINGVYVKIEVQPQELQTFFKVIKDFSFKGLSVTMPLKELVIPYLAVANASSINTIKIGEKMEGWSTDGMGAVEAIQKHLPLKGKKVVILGAGGAAQSIYLELIKVGAEVWVLNRTVEKAKKLAGPRGGDLNDLKKLEYDLLIDATPEALPINPEDIHKNAWFFDVKLRPAKDALHKYLSKNIYGWEMFQYQALYQDEIWFGIKPYDQIEQLVKDAVWR